MAEGYRFQSTLVPSLVIIITSVYGLCECANTKLFMPRSNVSVYIILVLSPLSLLPRNNQFYNAIVCYLIANAGYQFILPEQLTTDSNMENPRNKMEAFFEKLIIFWIYWMLYEKGNS